MSEVKQVCQVSQVSFPVVLVPPIHNLLITRRVVLSVDYIDCLTTQQQSHGRDDPSTYQRGATLQKTDPTPTPSEECTLANA